MCSGLYKFHPNLQVQKIEHVRNGLELNIRKHKIKGNFIGRVEYSWQNLFSPLPRRLQAVINTKGIHIKYQKYYLYAYHNFYFEFLYKWKYCRCFLIVFNYDLLWLFLNMFISEILFVQIFLTATVSLYFEHLIVLYK